MNPPPRPRGRRRAALASAALLAACLWIWAAGGPDSPPGERASDAPGVPQHRAAPVSVGDALVRTPWSSGESSQSSHEPLWDAPVLAVEHLDAPASGDEALAGPPGVVMLVEGEPADGIAAAHEDEAAAIPAGAQIVPLAPGLTALPAELIPTDGSVILVRPAGPSELGAVAAPGPAAPLPGARQVVPYTGGALPPEVHSSTPGTIVLLRPADPGSQPTQVAAPPDAAAADEIVFSYTDGPLPDEALNPPPGVVIRLRALPEQ